MPKKAVLTFTLLALAACFFSYKLGSSPVALAKSHSPQDGAVAPPLPSPPATWVLHQDGNAPSSVTKPAGGAGVQHVVDCISATVTQANGQQAGGIINLQLLDGAGIQYLQWGLPIAANTGPPSQISICGLTSSASQTSR